MAKTAGSRDAELVDLLLIKNQQGLRQLKFMINKNVEADLYTAQGFEALGAGLTMGIRAYPPAGIPTPIMAGHPTRRVARRA